MSDLLFCEKCRDRLLDPKNFTPLLCSQCGEIVRIFPRDKKLGMRPGEVIFCKSCRRCNGEEGEKEYVNHWSF
jgi:hypothetical protein